MQTEPSKAEPPKRKRRRFQFRLRTLLAFVLICGVGAVSLTRTTNAVSRDDDGRSSPTPARNIGLSSGMTRNEVTAIAGQTRGSWGTRRWVVIRYQPPRLNGQFIEVVFRRDDEGIFRMRSWAFDPDEGGRG